MIRIAFCLFFVGVGLFSNAQQEMADKFVGSWVADKMESADMTVEDSLEFEEMKEMLVFIFGKDGVFSIPLPDEIAEEMIGEDEDLGPMTGTWSLEAESKITICFEADDCEIMEYSFEGTNILKLTDGYEDIYFVRK